MEIKLEPSWKTLLKEEFNKPYFISLKEFIKREYFTKQIFPPGKWIFRALDECPVEKVKIIILGQDPYHTPGVANGLSFSVSPGQRLPPSLKNIYKELKSDLEIDAGLDGDLSRWARQGVLMLNSTLTVEKGSPNSHSGMGWEVFTDTVIKKLAEAKLNLVFILWGAYAQKKGSFIDESKHMVIKSAHPSPFSAEKGFFGSKPFSRANNYLKDHGEKPIQW
jgi:uracil-DNA glycosylase